MHTPGPRQWKARVWSTRRSRACSTGKTPGTRPPVSPTGKQDLHLPEQGQSGRYKTPGPQPVSPFTPPAGSSYSLSGGQVGAGVVALLFCVFASGLILLRREFKLSWNFCELPKPNSVLLLPPERPGNSALVYSPLAGQRA